MPSAAPDSTADLRTRAAQLAADCRYQDALPLLWQALALAPDSVETLNALGNTLVSVKRPDDAIPFFLHALEMLPQDARLHNNLGLAYCEFGRFDDADAAFLQALRLDPFFVGAYNNHACLCIMTARHHQALRILDLALKLDPTHLSSRRNRALALLSLGRFEDAWQDFDFYAAHIPHPPDPFPLWTGQPLAGRRILLTAYAGLGDTILFIRYAHFVQKLGAHVIFQCPTPLLRVFASVSGIDELITPEQPLPAADFSSPLMALPRVFNTSLPTIPSSPAYLQPEPLRRDLWAQRLSACTSRPLRVGLCWQGNPHHQWDRFRSLPLALFAPLAKLPHVQLVSLQRGPGIEQIPAFQDLTHNALLVPTTGTQSSPDDLADSAAIISLLDLFITVDSAPAHLAGALGKPTWIALSRTADWRWLTDRSDSPWYPSVRLFRQTAPGDWPSVISQLAAALSLGVNPST
jgi:Tfp pilus assembly protein PilF